MGAAYVDDADNPSVFKLDFGFFNYYAGDPTAAGAQAIVDALVPWTLQMPSAPGWAELFQSAYGDRLATMKRYRFSGAALSAAHLSGLLDASGWQEQVKPMDLEFVSGLWGKDHFISVSDYDSPEDFVTRSAGFYLPGEDGVAGAAYGSLVCSRGIEVSLYVEEAKRRRCVATALAAALLLWCLQRGAAANWDAANLESCGLAEKLGYRPAGSYKAYYLRPPE